MAVKNDERLVQVEAEKQAALNEIESTYGSMISQSDGYYQAQIDASKQWADKQSQLQQEKTDFAIEQIEQQKAQEKKEYTREQSGAYVDWQKQSNQYGADAEQMAASGMTNTGYSESSQVSMYNTYQNRVATARESYTLAVQNYNNAITEARLQNNSILAEIAYTALQQQLELSLQGFQYKNSLVMAKLDAKNDVSNSYWGRYTDVLNQINTENALAEEIRQYNASLAEEQRQFAASQEESRYQFDTAQKQDQAQFEAQLAETKNKNATDAAAEAARLAEEKRQFELQYAEAKRQYDSEMSLKRAQFEASQKQQQTAKAATTTKGGSSTKYDSKTNTSYIAPSKAKFTGNTYESAVSYMTKNGVATAAASNVMTKNEWQRRKAAGSTGASTKNYSSYQEYLADYVSYQVANSKK